MRMGVSSPGSAPVDPEKFTGAVLSRKLIPERRSQQMKLKIKFGKQRKLSFSIAKAVILAIALYYCR